MNLQTKHPLIIDGLGYLNVVANKSEQLILKVLDIQGKIAKTIIEKIEQGAHELMVNLSDLSEGIYVLNAFSGDSFIKAIHFTKQ